MRNAFFSRYSNAWEISNGVASGILREDRVLDLVLEGVHGLHAGDLARGVNGRLDAVAGDLVGDLEQFLDGRA